MEAKIGRPAPFDIFEELDAAPMTWRHYAFWFFSTGGALLSGFSVIALGIAFPLLKRDYILSPQLVGLIGAALVLGAVLGGALGGVAADRFGRKRVFIANMAIMAVAGLMAALAPNPWFILGAQFLLGFGIGSDFPTSASYVSELMPVKARSVMTVGTIATQSVGMIGAALLALAIFKIHPAMADWRLLLGANGAIAILYLLGRLWLPESVRWLAIKGRFEEATYLLHKLSKQFGEKPPKIKATEIAAAEAKDAPHQANAPGYASLFSGPYRARTLLVSLPWLLMDVATYGVGLFTPVILGAMHFGAPGGGPIAADFADAEGSAAVDLFLLLGSLASLFAVAKFGRIPMQVAGFLGMALGMLLLLCAVLIGDRDSMHIPFVLSGFILYNFAMTIGPNATTFTLAPSLFPTAIRGAASGFAAACSKVGATLGILAVPQLNAAFGLIGVVLLMLVVSLAGLVATAALTHVVNEEGELVE